jgi:hypothetical protein
MTFTHIYFTMWEIVLGPKGGENAKGLSSSPFLAINAKEGESIKPKAKGLHHHFQNRNTIFKIFEIHFFNGYLSFKLICESKISNGLLKTSHEYAEISIGINFTWYLFQKPS